MRESSQLQVRLEAAKSEITKLLNERWDQEKDAKQQLVTLSQRLLDKEQQICHLGSLIEANRVDGQRQLKDIRYLRMNLVDESVN